MKKILCRFAIAVFIIVPVVCTIPSSSSAGKNKIQVYKQHSSKAGPQKISGSRVQILSRDPYLGAVAVDAGTENVLFEDNADATGYPASMVKMMNMLIILEAIDAKQMDLQEEITVSEEVARIGGSQVYLKENEVFTVEELLYALAVQSANDAATALAIHYAGSKEAFVHIMNRRGRELGMKDTEFHSVHGLPPGRGQLPDISTPRDMVKLSLKLLKHPEALKYTSTKMRLFRTDIDEPFIMRNHNHLVRDFEGCDGLKTGYFHAAGFSIAATAANKEGRAVAVIMGSAYSKVRDKKAREFLASSLAEIALNPPPQTVEDSEKAMIAEGWSFPGGNQYLFVLLLICSAYVVRKLNR